MLFENMFLLHLVEEEHAYNGKKFFSQIYGLLSRAIEDITINRRIAFVHDFELQLSRNFKSIFLCNNDTFHLKADGS